MIVTLENLKISKGSQILPFPRIPDLTVTEEQLKALEDNPNEEIVHVVEHNGAVVTISFRPPPGVLKQAKANTSLTRPCWFQDLTFGSQVIKSLNGDSSPDKLLGWEVS